jgi:hypothetical protein
MVLLMQFKIDNEAGKTVEYSQPQDANLASYGCKYP